MLPSTADGDHIDSKPKKNFNIAIIGGGLGGLSLAVTLLHHNVPFHVYEAAPAFSEIGAGVSFGPNALRTIPLLDPAIKAGYERCVTRNADPEKRDVFVQLRYGCDSRNGNGKKAGDLLHELKVGKLGHGFVHRARFLDVLVSLLPEGVASFGKSLEGVEEVEEGVRMRFGDGTEAVASAVIGCDGIKSKMRRILLGEHGTASTPRFAGEYAYRGLIDMESAKQLVGERASNGQMYLAYGGYMVTYPVDGGKTMNLNAILATEKPWEHDSWLLDTTEEEMMQGFKCWGEDIRRLINAVAKPVKWGMFEVPPAHTYARNGRICLMGDSAHASLPHMGTGAGMAFEDAYLLGHLLGEIQDRKDLENAFSIYERVRKPITQKIVAESRSLGRIEKLMGEGIGDDMEKIVETMNDRFNWLWKMDIESQVTEARNVLRSQMS